MQTEVKDSNKVIFPHPWLLKYSAEELLLLLLFVIALWFLVWEWRRVARRKRLL